MTHCKALLRASLAAGFLISLAVSAQAATLDDIQSRGYLQCGSNPGLAGFAAANDQGEWAGFDVDFCRAVAAAVLGDAEKVRFTPLSAQVRFTALQSGEVDLLARNTTWTFSRDVQLGFEFIGINYYDGQGFLVRKEAGLSSALEMDGASVCVQTGTTTEQNLGDWAKSNQINIETVVFEKKPEALGAYRDGRCDAYTTDASGLAADRSTLSDPAAHVILPEIISKEPLGPLVRHGDAQWGDINRWVLFALITAEELGVTGSNVADMAQTSKNPEIGRLLGSSDSLGQSLGLDANWALRAIAAGGNYGEIFARHLGPDTPLALERGLNAQWTDGGLLYSPPFR